jgi:hypothetical protein
MSDLSALDQLDARIELTARLLMQQESMVRRLQSRHEDAQMAEVLARTLRESLDALAQSRQILAGALEVVRRLRRLGLQVL